MKKIYNRLLCTLLLSVSMVSGYSQSRAFTGKPIYQILTKRAGVYLGTTTVELFPNIAPLAVSNFDSLVNVHFFDTTAFHRVIPGFMIQGGDPNSRHGPRSTWGNGDPSQPDVPAEFSVAKHVRGILSAARDTSINSANSQFFICVAPASWLDGQYSIYGHVTSGMNIVDTIVNAPRDSVDDPYQKIEMFVTYLGSNDTIPNAPTLSSPANGSATTASGKVLTWNAQYSGIIYHLDVATDSSFTSIVKSINLGTNSNTVTGLVTGNTYYWRVMVNNGGHFSPYSPIWHFNKSAVGIESYTLNDKITVAPNPSNGQFTFSNLDKESTIEIFDITGRSIYQSVSKNTNETINLGDKAKGIYFYRITDPEKQVGQGKIMIQ